MFYYVNKNAQSGGEHEVHLSSCNHLPEISNCQYLGSFSSCQEAIIAARGYYNNVDGCFYCCYSCHRR